MDEAKRKKKEGKRGRRDGKQTPFVDNNKHRTEPENTTKGRGSVRRKTAVKKAGNKTEKPKPRCITRGKMTGKEMTTLGTQTASTSTE